MKMILRLIFQGVYLFNYQTRMNVDIAGALEQLNRSWKAFEHRGKPMAKDDVRAVLKYGLSKGYKHTGQLSNDEVDKVLKANL